MNNAVPSQYPPQYQQPATPPAHYYSDSSFVSGLGVVLLIFGAAITHNHTVPLIGLGLIVLAHWFD